IPDGRMIYSFEYTPLEPIKKKLGDKVTVVSGIRTADLNYKSKQEIIDEVKKCIDIGAPGGGFIFRTTSGIDYAKPENVEAMFDTLHNYGKK
ncbi:MAG: hypothetical protein IKX81_00615, partial [Firmicutes bacterium]|nr:hypothetical protein [Bacillota bacterium]